MNTVAGTFWKADSDTVTGTAREMAPASAVGAEPASGEVRSCLRRLEETTNALKHWPHLKGRSPECTRRCLFRLERSAKDLPHSEQANGRCPVWTSMCRRRSQDATKALSQLWHLYGPRSAGCRKRLVHLSHGYGLKPEWALWWRRKLDGSENILPHCGHRKGFSPECGRWPW
uniref:Uncharacterized protein n=1 Tax=Scleropages formosus TaxID=113540 RepID=A0A8C9UY55_SCLFO